MNGTVHEPRVVETFRLGRASAQILEWKDEELQSLNVKFAIGSATLDDAPESDVEDIPDFIELMRAAQTLADCHAGRRSLVETMRRLRDVPLEAV